jgi:hypothetical protein
MDKRRHTRYTLWFPVDVVANGEKKTLAVAKDASQSGIAISSPAGMDVGERVTLSFRIPPGSGEERTVSGTVARHERNPDDPNGLWPHRIGIEFEEELPELEALLAEAGTKTA